MKVEKFTHENVLPDGTFSDKRGQIGTKGNVILVDGGCPLKGCHCSDGHSLTIVSPLKDGKVEGMIVYFNNRKEMLKYLTL